MFLTNILAIILTFSCVNLIFFIFYLKSTISHNSVKNRDEFFRKLKNNNKYATSNKPLILGFFHPYCNSGGGGERVLWTAIHSIQEKYPNVICVVYTGDVDATKREILSKVLTRFDIEIKPDNVEFVFLYKRIWVVEQRYPRFTLLGQSIGSMILGYEALSKITPDIYFDTMGYAFTYPIAKKLFKCKVLAYVHYPTISSDMLTKVQERRPGFNNDKMIAKSRLFSKAKLLYYKIFAYLYSLSGSYAEIVMVNSTWTKGHIDQLWGINSNIVYPPCNTDSLSKLPLDGRERIIVSVAQFRPEKDHELQLKSLHFLLRDHPDFHKGPEKVRLVLIGSCRNPADGLRIEALKEKTKELCIEVG